MAWLTPVCVVLQAINRMERKFLELLQYTVTVPSSLYAKYFFELRTLARDNNMSFRLQPLTPEEVRLRALPHAKHRPRPSWDPIHTTSM